MKKFNNMGTKSDSRVYEILTWGVARGLHIPLEGKDTYIDLDQTCLRRMQQRGLQID